MLKEFYKETMDKHIPDEKLIDSTKNAMYDMLSASDSINRKALFAATGTQQVTKKSKFAYKKLACACALISLAVGIGVIGAVVTSNSDNSMKQDDSFASSGYSAFEGDAANSGKDSSSIIITSTTTQENAVTTAAAVDSEKAPLQTTVFQVTTATDVCQTTVITTTTTAVGTQNPVEVTTIATSATTTAVVTTTTTAANVPEEIPHKGFGYYDPEYDPGFKGEFEHGFEEEFLFEYENIYYYFDCRKSDKVMLEFEGTQCTLRQAIDEKLVLPQELLEFEGFICKGYYNDDHMEEPIGVHLDKEAQMQAAGGFMDGGYTDCEGGGEQQAEQNLIQPEYAPEN